jgi:hypothetical protein
MVNRDCNYSDTQGARTYGTGFVDGSGPGLPKVLILVTAGLHSLTR